MTSDQLMEYNVSNNSLQKSYAKCGGDASPRNQNQNLN